MNDIKIRQGETLELIFESDDTSAETVEIKAVDDQDGIVFNQTATFSDKKASIRIDDTMVPIGDYRYTVTFKYTDGYTEIYSKNGLCGEDCEFAKITICESLEGVS